MLFCDPLFFMPASLSTFFPCYGLCRETSGVRQPRASEMRAAVRSWAKLGANSTHTCQRDPIELVSAYMARVGTKVALAILGGPHIVLER